jgi:hypothetical protein
MKGGGSCLGFQQMSTVVHMEHNDLTPYLTYGYGYLGSKYRTIPYLSHLTMLIVGSGCHKIVQKKLIWTIDGFEELVSRDFY